ncbi:ricin-type beta-trefoil lectin domain protein [Actinoplanes sp. NPDC051859]|uniref:ricin-type beta-trefoil lectin domain protein n=1 Tax=Actinoplanes sp. NPDC051859 TaxID=3363909 RepID=UPI0037B6CAD7
MFRSLFRLRQRDDAGTLHLVVLLSMVGMSLSALVLPMVLAQVTSARREMQRDRALYAAQAGLDVTIGRIRLAQDGAGTGSRTKLPCETLAGNADAGGAQYTVDIVYLATDPQGQSADWIKDNKMPCKAGLGTDAVPRFALLTSTGSDRGNGARVLHGTYVFNTNTGMDGGVIRVDSSRNKSLCLAAESDTPRAGEEVTVQPCLSGGAAQLFARTPDYQLVLVASKTTAPPYGMCLDNLDGKAEQKKDNVIRFQPCKTVVPPNQQWSYEDEYRTYHATSNGRKINSFCLTVRSPDFVGSPLILGINCKEYNSAQMFLLPTNFTAGPVKDLSEN